MKRRFLIVLYAAGLLFVTAVFIAKLFSIDFDELNVISYKAKCLSNNQYVVLEGDQSPYIFTNVVLKDDSLETQKDLNFYCGYYDQIQPFITAYNNSTTRIQQMAVNKGFFEFEDRYSPTISIGSVLYSLEKVSSESRWYLLFEPLLSALFLFAFIYLLRLAFVYVSEGKIAIHPFKIYKK